TCLASRHSADQLHKVTPDINVVGVNNRNLKTFEVSIQNSIEVANAIPSDVIKISESGISDPQSIVELKEHGFDGFLIGETFMKTAQPHLTCAAFIRKIERLEKLYQGAIA
ncbi:MAG: indole-3-glycerol-phosphate synthase TrpC, partial [Bacteroidota bacterium]